MRGKSGLKTHYSPIHTVLFCLVSKTKYKNQPPISLCANSCSLLDTTGRWTIWLIDSYTDRCDSVSYLNPLRSHRPENGRQMYCIYDDSYENDLPFSYSLLNIEVVHQKI